MENNLSRVLCVTTPEKAVNYRWEENSELLDGKGIAVVDMVEIKRLQTEGVQFDNAGAIITEGTVFGLHPYRENCYVNLALPEEELLDAKVDLLAQFYKYLGVRSIHFEAEFSEEEKREFSADGSVKYKVVEAKAEYKNTQENKMKKRFSRNETYEGEFSDETYRKAQNMYKQIGFNRHLQYLLKQRNPEDGNKIKSQEIEVELTSELNELTEAAFSLTAFGGVFSLKGNFMEKVSTKKTIKLKTKIEF